MSELAQFPPRSWPARVFGHPSAPGIVLALATVAALVVSNSGWAALYRAIVEMPGQVQIGSFLTLSKPMVIWVNDLWMAVFFLYVGLEIKRELVEGDLADRRQALLPAVAAVGGMALPALIYAGLNFGDAVALKGWAIPAATDIAFAVGIVILLGSRVPASLRVFLTAVAIFDDLGAIVVIAIFYTAELSLLMLAVALAGVAVLTLLNRFGVVRADVYVVVGLLVWVAVLKSGVHATLAGIAVALAVPMRGPGGRTPALDLEHALHPWVAFAVLPLFAFTNAGLSLADLSLDTLFAGIPLGIAAGLVFGKTAGIFGTVSLMVRRGWAAWPSGTTPRQCLGVAVLCGIGFTMSLFIGGLAFTGLEGDYATYVKLGVLAGSLISGIVGTAIVVTARREPA
jgi:NhaA family Na+:H+ antiporter